MNLKEMQVQDIATAMGLSADTLWKIAQNSERYYKPEWWSHTKKSKTRLIDEPKPWMKKLLKRLHQFLQKKIKWHPSAHGGIKRRSTFTSAHGHKGQSVVVSRDIENCYPSVEPNELRRRLRRLGFQPDVAKLLSLLLTVRGRIPQGSPTSGDALNLFLYDADRGLRKASRQLGGKYTRLVDDMIISGSSDCAPEAGRFLEAEIKNHGLRCNLKKKSERGKQPRHLEQRVHNLIVNSARGLRIPSEQADRALAIAGPYVRGAKVVNADSIEALARKRERVTGHMYYFQQADFGPARRIYRLLHAGDCAVSRRLESLNLSPYKKKWWLRRRKRNEPRRLARLWRKKMKAKEAQRGYCEAVS